MVIPGSGETCPSVEFKKQGALSDEELVVFTAALRAANQVTKEAAAAAQVSLCRSQTCQLTSPSKVWGLS